MSSPVLEQTRMDTSRHNSVFSSVAFGQTRVDIIGCGATGSRIALALAKLGVLNLHIWDFDMVESHNLPNQMFGLNDVGSLKVEALADIILEQTGLSVTMHNERVDGSQRLGEVVFLLTDTMASRKEIWDKGIKFRGTVHLMVETRMGTDQGRIYCVCPTRDAAVTQWENSLYPDEVATDSRCGSRTSVGPTADLITGHAMWSFIQWFQHYQHPEKHPFPVSEYLFGALSPQVSAIDFQ